MSKTRSLFSQLYNHVDLKRFFCINCSSSHPAPIIQFEQYNVEWVSPWVTFLHWKETFHDLIFTSISVLVCVFFTMSYIFTQFIIDYFFKLIIMSCLSFYVLVYGELYEVWNKSSCVFFIWKISSWKFICIVHLPYIRLLLLCDTNVNITCVCDFT